MRLKLAAVASSSNTIRVKEQLKPRATLEGERVSTFEILLYNETSNLHWWGSNKKKVFAPALKLWYYYICVCHSALVTEDDLLLVSVTHVSHMSQLKYHKGYKRHNCHKCHMCDMCHMNYFCCSVKI
jgi:hypothetical protein